jgi:hypothetical protein
MAVLGEEPAWPDAVRAANITCAGILSHESAMLGGKRLPLPAWTHSNDAPFVVALAQDRRPPWVGETSNGQPASMPHRAK